MRNESSITVGEAACVTFRLQISHSCGETYISPVYCGINYLNMSKNITTAALNNASQALNHTCINMKS